MTNPASSAFGANPVPTPTADRTTIAVAVSVAAVSGLAWAGSYLLTSGPMMAGGGPLFNLGPQAVGLFLVVWVLGMVAMMFPAMLPFILFYVKVVIRSERLGAIRRPLATSFFLGGYLAVYAALGLGLYSLVQLVSLGSSGFLSASVTYWMVVISLAVVGAYQLSPFKVEMLSKCVSPIGFFSIHKRRSGLIGGLKMGLSHGGYCAGCCWAYMLVMLAVAAMSLPLMAALAAVISLEKLVTKGAAWFRRGVAIGFFALAFGSLLFPGLLSALNLV